MRAASSKVAWLGFLLQWSKSADARAWWHGQLGLNANDVSRLRRRWRQRMDRDKAVAIAAAEISARGPKPMPPLRVAPIELRPFPWSKRTAKSAAERAAGSPGAAPPDDFPLDRYAWLSAELAALPKARALVLARHGLTENSLADLDRRWQPAIAGEIGADFRGLVAHHRARLDAARQSVADKNRAASWPSPTPPTPSPPLPPRALRDETELIFAALNDEDVLPFVSSPAKLPPPPVPLAPCPEAGETAFAFQALSDEDVLPFATEAAPPSARLKLRQLAAVAVEMALAPADRAAILERYGLSDDGARTAFAASEQDRQRDPAVRAQWDEAYTEYYAYRVRSTGR